MHFKIRNLRIFRLFPEITITYPISDFNLHHTSCIKLTMLAYHR